MRKYDPQQNKDYRKSELYPEVAELFQKARDEKGKSVVPSMIDMAIYLQETRSVYTACNYVRYLLFYELTYAEVFGKQAKEFDKHIEHFQQCIDLELKVNSLTITVNEMNEKFDQMQIMMMNMAKMLTTPEKVRKTA